MKIIFAVRILIVLVLVGRWQQASAGNSKPELQAVIGDLLTWWPGEYDSLAQVELERQRLMNCVRWG